MTRGRVAAVVLAAGTSARFGSTKQLARLSDGRPLVRATVESLAAGSVDDVVVVIGHDAGRVADALTGLDVRVVMNESYELGMASSVVAGIAALGPDTGAAIVALGDQPLPEGVVDRLIEIWRAHDARIVVPSYRGRRGNPVLFDAEMFADLGRVEGDRGARDLIAMREHQVELAELDIAQPIDVDTPDDLFGVGS